MINITFHRRCISTPMSLAADVTLGLFKPLQPISTVSDTAPPSHPGLNPQSPLSRARSQKLPTGPRIWAPDPFSMVAFPQHQNADKTDWICIHVLVLVSVLSMVLVAYPASPSSSMAAFPQHENAHKTDLICIQSLERALVRATLQPFQILSSHH